MDKKNYNKKIQEVRQYLDKNYHNETVAKIYYGATENGWGIIGLKWCLSIRDIAKTLKCSRTLIRNELSRGLEKRLRSFINDTCKEFAYNMYISINRRLKIVQKLLKNVKKPKILNNQKLYDFVIKSINEHQSLFGISGRLKALKEKKEKLIKEGKLDEASLIDDIETISANVLYKYTRNKKVKGIDSKARIRRFKNNSKREDWKRQNGLSIAFRPEDIRKRKEFGHWEMDLKGVSKSSPCQLLVLQEMLTRYIILVLLPNKKYQGILVYVKNCKSITTDNGSEFWGWEEFSKVINSNENINIYFAHPRAPWEKGGVENANLMIVDIMGDRIIIDLSCENGIQEAANEINNKWRSVLNFQSAKELYNVYTQNIL